MAARFEMVSKFQPAGDQPQAIDKIIRGFTEGKSAQVLMGATGTGKTATASWVIAQVQKPTLVLAHNKTLAAQLYKEFRMRIELFGDEVEALELINPTSGETLRKEEELYIYPAKHFVTPDERIRTAVEGIRQELEQRRAELHAQGKLLEENRLAARTNYDMEMLLQVG